MKSIAPASGVNWRKDGQTTGAGHAPAGAIPDLSHGQGREFGDRSQPIRNNRAVTNGY